MDMYLHWARSSIPTISVKNKSNYLLDSIPSNFILVKTQFKPLYALFDSYNTHICIV